MDHRDDPNFDPSAPVIDDETPYPEVRSAVSNTDDPSMPSSTIRSWGVGLIFVVLTSSINQFFSLRYPYVFVTMVRVCPVVLSLPPSLAKSNFARKGYPPGVEFPHLQSLGSLPAEYFPFWHPT